MTGGCVNQLHHGRIETNNISFLALFQTTLQKILHNINARDEGPDRVGEHEWNDMFVMGIGKEAESAQKIHRVIPKTRGAQLSIFVPYKRKKGEKG